MQEILELADDDAAHMWRTLSLGYTETQGLPELREQIAAGYAGAVAREDVVVSAPQEAILLAMHAVLRPGDTVVATSPGYQSLTEVAENIGCCVRLWRPTGWGQGELRFDASDLADLVDEHTKMVVVNFPHNPTGLTLEADAWDEVVSVCRGANAYLFSDEMYRLLEFDESDRLPGAVEVYDKGMSLSGLSKTIGLPGVRIGWIACRDGDVIRRMLELKDFTTICSSAPSEVLALMALRAQDTLLGRRRDLVRANKQRAEEFFAGLPESFALQPPQAGPVAFPRLTTGQDVGAFCEEVVGACGVLLLPATVYGDPDATRQGHFRIGLGRSNFGTGLEVLQDFLAARRDAPSI
ncbi:unnamed protein product [Pedinophyceae sp. YPF-701]|nr:unnamed protein product [Pedinophyceae sp. YPF-701]